MNRNLKGGPKSLRFLRVLGSANVKAQKRGPANQGIVRRPGWPEPSEHVRKWNKLSEFIREASMKLKNILKL